MDLNYAEIIKAYFMIDLICLCSARRFSKTEDTSSSYSQKRCIAWFREYTSPDDPDTLGEFNDSRATLSFRVSNIAELTKYL